MNSEKGLSGLFDQPTVTLYDDEFKWQDLANVLVAQSEFENQEEVFVAGAGTLRWIKRKEKEGWIFNYKKGVLYGVKPHE